MRTLQQARGAAPGWEGSAQVEYPSQNKRGQSYDARPGGNVGRNVLLLPLAAISASQHNPRRKLHGIEELAESLQTYGLLQPVVVRWAGERYELVAGHRRLAAARLLGWATIPGIVRPADEDEAYLLTLVENLQRENLSPREEADALEVLVRQRGWSTRQVAAAVQRSQAFVSKRLRVFEDAALAPAVLADKLSVSAAEELLGVAGRRRYELVAQAIEEKWDRAQVRKAAGVGPFAATRRESRGLARGVRELRMRLRDVRAEDVTEAERRELRLLFTDLALMARTRPGAKRVFPPLPKVPGARS